MLFWVKMLCTYQYVMHDMSLTYLMECNVCLCLKRHFFTWYDGEKFMCSLKMLHMICNQLTT